MHAQSYAHMNVCSVVNQWLSKTCDVGKQHILSKAASTVRCDLVTKESWGGREGGRERQTERESIIASQ